MRQASKRIPESAETTVRDIRRATRRHHSAEEKIRDSGQSGRTGSASAHASRWYILDYKCRHDGKFLSLEL